MVEQAFLDGVGLDTPARLEARVFRMFPLPHHLDDYERREAVEIRFAAARRAGRAHFAIDVQTRPEDGRVADAPGDLPREPAGGRHAADLAFRADPVAIDRPIDVILVDDALGNQFHHHAPRRGLPLDRIQIVHGIGGALPAKPRLARTLGVEIGLDGEAHVARECLASCRR